MKVEFYAWSTPIGFTNFQNVNVSSFAVNMATLYKSTKKKLLSTLFDLFTIPIDYVRIKIIFYDFLKKTSGWKLFLVPCPGLLITLKVKEVWVGQG